VQSFIRLTEFLSRHPVLFAMAAAVVVFVPGLLLAMLTVEFLPVEPSPLHPYVRALTALVLAPVVETIVMVPMMTIAERFVPNTHGVIFVCAALWAGLHATLVPESVPFVFWGFTILGYVYVYWRKLRPNSFLWIVMLTHAFANAPAGVAAIAT
jgi:hypothetical protein